MILLLFKPSSNGFGQLLSADFSGELTVIGYADPSAFNSLSLVMMVHAIL